MLVLVSSLSLLPINIKTNWRMRCDVLYLLAWTRLFGKLQRGELDP